MFVLCLFVYLKLVYVGGATQRPTISFNFFDSSNGFVQNDGVGLDHSCSDPTRPKTCKQSPNLEKLSSQHVWFGLERSGVISRTGGLG